MQAVILAGGKGVRLRPFTSCLPKPLVPLGSDEVILEVVLTQLAAQGFTEVVLATGHMGHLIRACIGDGRRYGLSVRYHQEVTPLGTTGPLVTLRDDLAPDVVVLNADLLTDLDFRSLLCGHVGSRAPLTVCGYERTVHVDFGVLDLLGDRLIGFSEKPTLAHLVNMGVYGLSRTILDRYEPGRPLGFDQVMRDLLASGELPRVVRHSGYWLDIGRPEDYDQATSDFDQLRPRLMNPAPLVGQPATTAGPAQNGALGSALDDGLLVR